MSTEICQVFHDCNIFAKVWVKAFLKTKKCTDFLKNAGINPKGFFAFLPDAPHSKQNKSILIFTKRAAPFADKHFAKINLKKRYLTKRSCRATIVKTKTPLFAGLRKGNRTI